MVVDVSKLFRLVDIAEKDLPLTPRVLENSNGSIRCRLAATIGFKTRCYGPNGRHRSIQTGPNSVT